MRTCNRNDLMLGDPEYGPILRAHRAEIERADSAEHHAKFRWLSQTDKTRHLTEEHLDFLRAENVPAVDVIVWPRVLHGAAHELYDRWQY